MRWSGCSRWNGTRCRFLQRLFYLIIHFTYEWDPLTLKVKAKCLEVKTTGGCKKALTCVLRKEGVPHCF